MPHSPAIALLARTPSLAARTRIHLLQPQVLMHKLTLIRRPERTARDFRSLIREISFYLGYEATQGLRTREVTVATTRPEPCMGKKISDTVAVIPILRGGLGMVEPLLELLPNSPVYHIGMYRNPGSQIPVQYFNRLPKGKPSDIAFVLDPVIASSKTICATISILKKWGAKKIKVLTLVASKCGLAALLEQHPDVAVHAASIDELAENGVDLVPGIGDAGDRLYYTGANSYDEDLLSPPAARKVPKRK
ncbi:unnamed protein product [Chrysoparadoxa australica]